MHLWESVETVASRMQSDPETVRRWCRSGRVECRQTPGGQWRIHCEETGFPVTTGRRARKSAA